MDLSQSNAGLWGATPGLILHVIQLARYSQNTVEQIAADRELGQLECYEMSVPNNNRSSPSKPALQNGQRPAGHWRGHTRNEAENGPVIPLEDPIKIWGITAVVMT